MQCKIITHSGIIRQAIWFQFQPSFIIESKSHGRGSRREERKREL